MRIKGIASGVGMILLFFPFSLLLTIVTGKLILSFLMWFGRLELITGLVLFLPSTYRV
jgi:Trk-type K+ transport system membrane component